MEIESIRHEGLRQYAETGNHKGLVGDADRIRNMLLTSLRSKQKTTFWRRRTSVRTS